LPRCCFCGNRSHGLLRQFPTASRGSLSISPRIANDDKVGLRRQSQVLYKENGRHPASRSTVISSAWPSRPCTRTSFEPAARGPACRRPHLVKNRVGRIDSVLLCRWSTSRPVLPTASYKSAPRYPEMGHRGRCRPPAGRPTRPPEQVGLGAGLLSLRRVNRRTRCFRTAARRISMGAIQSSTAYRALPYLDESPGRCVRAFAFWGGGGPDRQCTLPGG